jgi:uncharacterized membrane protein
MGCPRYYMIYVAMAVAAPIFLFLVGFCLPLSKARETARCPCSEVCQAGRATDPTGLLLNLLVFRGSICSNSCSRPSA